LIIIKVRKPIEQVMPGYIVNIMIHIINQTTESEVSIMDMLGRIVYNAIIFGGEVNVSWLLRDVYIVRINDKELKFIKE
jgi:hypothetical protein